MGWCCRRQKVKQPSYSDRQQGHYQTKYSVHIRLENGKTKIIQYTEELFNYYQIGDHVGIMQVRQVIFWRNMTSPMILSFTASHVRAKTISITTYATVAKVRC